MSPEQHSPTGECLLEVRDLRVAFASGRALHPAVDGVSLAISAGETVALVGESGCGKSVTALALLRLLPPAARIRGGIVRLEGADLLQLSEAEMRGARGRGLAMIFQEPATSLNPVLSVGRQLGEVLERHLGLTGSAAAARAADLLGSVGIADPPRRLGEYPFQLSGGMKQRVMIAMALAVNPRLLVADEPTTALDVTIQAQILELLRSLQVERSMGLLLISHDLGVVAQMATRVCVMYAGQIVEDAPRELFFSSARHPYTRKLFAALPDLARRGSRLETIAGQVPPLSAMPRGCRFAERCEYARDLCREVAPAWRPVGPEQWLRCHFDELARAGGPTSGAALASRVAEPGPAAQGSEPRLLVVSDLQVHFPIRRGVLQRVVGQVRAVEGVSLEVARGRTLALVGESGCGKTTAGKAILQLVTPTAGSVRLLGRELVGESRGALRPLRRRMQMIFQDPFASLNPRLSVGEIIAEGMRTLGVGRSPGSLALATAAALEQVGLDASAARRYPHEFSGGQRQRIAIARALVVEPELVVCDEPTSALDVSVQAQILNLLSSLQADLGLGYLFITHNLAVVDHLAHEVAVMYLGRIVERGTVDEVLRTPQHPYTRALLSAVPSPRLDAQPQALRLPGEVPSPASPPAGCHFHPRCQYARMECRERFPEPARLTATHRVSCHLHTPEAGDSRRA